MGEIREKMVADLKIKNSSEHTIDSYLRYARKYVEHFGRPPTQLGREHVHEYLTYLTDERQVHPGTLAIHLAAISFLYRITLNRPDVVADIPRPRLPKKLPEILTGTEVDKILAAVYSIKHRTILTSTYAAGLRISEAVSLCVPDIQSDRRLIRVRQGKGKKDRYVPLGDRLLIALRDYWRAVRPPGPYLFPPGRGGQPDAHISRDAVHHALEKAVKRAGIQKHVTPHTFRHCCATHMLEMGHDLRTVQVILGHSSPRTTAIYTHVSAEFIGKVKSPLDVLGTEEGRILR